MADAPDPLDTGIDITDAVFLGSRVHKNVSQQFIFTTEDKIRICLTTYQEALAAGRDWIGPLGLLVSILATLVVTEKFRPFLGLTPDGWHTVFILSGVLSLALLGWTLFQTWRRRKERKIAFVINSLKSGRSA
jgi:hypothetical protein